MKDGSPQGTAPRWLQSEVVRYAIVGGILLVALVTRFWSVLIGKETFFLRDLLTTHIPAFSLFDGLRYAQINPAWASGAPWAGNPNLLVFYPTIHEPGFVSIHILIHLAIGFFGMILFMRRAVRVSRDGALLSGVLFTGSGYVLSSASFLNAVTTIAWVPWLLFVSDGRAIERRSSRIVLTTIVMILLVLGGEPALAAIALLVCAARLIVVNRKAVATFAASSVLAAALLAPIGMVVWETSRDSARAIAGYSFEEAMRASLHPARLLEIVTPFIFGRPDRIVHGAWWGFAVSRNAPAYIYSLSWSFLAILLIFLGRRTLREPSFWITTAFIGLVFSCGGFLPGAEIAYQCLPHSWRYPIKLVFPAVLAGSVLAGGALDGALAQRASHRGPGLVFIVTAALCAAGGILFLVSRETIVSTLADRWWGPTWRNDPHAVVGPLVQDAGWHLLLLAACCAACSVILNRLGSWRGSAIALLVLAEVASSASPLFPTVERVELASPSRFAAAAARHGPVYERAGKDIDAVRRGLNGRYPADETHWMAVAQARQAWATTGSMYGVRYAFNHDPDGSYPERIDYVSDLLDRRTWPERLKWLRAAGVRGVITFDARHLGDGYACIAEDTEIGIPAHLCAVREPLSEVRRSTHVIAATDRIEAAVRFEEEACDSRVCTVVEGGLSIAASADPSASAIVTSDRGDRMEIFTNGSSPAVLFVARPFRRTSRATVNGSAAPIRPANIAFTAIVVPAGKADVGIVW